MAREPKQFSVADWVPLETAYKRIETALNSGFLAMRDLLDDLRTGRLPSAVRRISRDGAKKTFCALEPASWQQMTLRVDYAKNFIVGDPHVDHVIFLSFYFVARQELDKLYPPGAAQRDHDDTNDSKEPLRAIDRAKTVLRDLHPTKAQMPGSLKAATREVGEECQTRGWAPPSEDTVQRAAEKLGYRPPRKRR